MDGRIYLIELRNEIKSTYGITNPTFSLDIKKAPSEKELIDWIEETESEGRWVQYSHVRNNLFSLKDYLPYPSLKSCLNIVKEYINERKKVASDTAYFMIESNIYSEKDAINEIIVSLGEGYPMVCGYYTPIEDPQNLGRTIYPVQFMIPELHWELRTGYRTLEHRKR